MRTIATLAALLVCTAAVAEDAVTPGEVTARATIRCVGIDWSVTGDENGNATCTVEYREAGGGNFRKALPLFRLRKHENVVAGSEYPWKKWHDAFRKYALAAWARNALAGSIFKLKPGTSYEIRLKLTDPDGGGKTETITVKTRAVPTLKASGPVVDITPKDIDKLKQLVQKAKPGTIIKLHAGLYETNLFLRASGEPDNPIVLKAAGDGEVVFQGLGPEVRKGPRSNQGFLMRGPHWRIHGITFRKWFDTILGGGTDIAITRCRFEGGRSAIRLRGKDCYIADCVMNGFQDPASGAFWPEGIELKGSGHVICYNSITRHGDQISIEASDTDIYGNDIHTASDDGIENDFGGPNVRIYDNRIYSIMHNGISFQPYIGGPCYVIRNQLSGFRENVFKDRYEASGLILLHNTMVNLTTTSLIRHTYARNNLFAATRQKYAMHYRPIDAVNWEMDLDHNGYMGKIGIGPWVRIDEKFVTARELANVTGNEEHGVTTTLEKCFASAIAVPRPPKVFTPAPVFRLKATSPAVDAGEVLPNVNDDFKGKAPDMGALELGTPEPHYGPRKP